MNILQQALRVVTFTAAQLADDDALKTAIATDNAAAHDYTGAALNGALANPGPAVMRLPQLVTVTTSAQAATYVTSSPIVVTGTDWNDAAMTENISLTQVGGGETVAGVKAFKTVSNIHVPQQTGAAGQFKFGVQDVVVDPSSGRKQAIIGVRFGSAANIKLGFDGSTSDTLPGILGEKYAGLALKVFATGTTSDPVSVYIGRTGGG